MKRLFNSKFIIFMIFLFLTVFVYCFSLKYVDTKVNDGFIKTLVFLGNAKNTNDTLIVAVDDKTLDKIPFAQIKNLYSEVFDFLQNEAGAKVIVFDNPVLFSGADMKSDTEFYSSLKTKTKLIGGYIMLNSVPFGEILPEEYKSLPDLKTNVKIIDNRKNKKTDSYNAIVNLPEEYLMNINNLAVSVMTKDNDKVVRSFVPFIRSDNKFYPSLALAAYAAFSNQDTFILTDNYLCSADECKTLKMPLFYAKTTDYTGNTVYAYQAFYDWYKPIQKYYSHKVYSAYDILMLHEKIKNGEQIAEYIDDFKDKIVIIGFNTADKAWNRHSATPVSKETANTDILATATGNLLNNSFRTYSNKDFTPVVTLIFCLFIVRGFRRFSYNLIFACILSFIYLAYYIQEYLSYVYIPAVTPVIAIFSAALFKHVYSLVTTDETNETIKRAMGKYLSKDVMKKVLKDADKLKLGGTRTAATLLFADIRNFTQIAENIKPQEVSAILNEYFSAIEPIIESYGGIVNKYMGDGILAVFGEPINDENHPLNAVKCGFKITEKVKLLREKFEKEGKPLISAGIGINTGEVFAGNIGTTERLEYTVIGDNVNLAYRIEAYNQLLKTQFLISEYTYNYVKDYVEVVKLTDISIKGKSKPIDIYEVLRIKNNER